MESPFDAVSPLLDTIAGSENISLVEGGPLRFLAVSLPMPLAVAFEIMILNVQVSQGIKIETR